jgi:Uma2 family endonuclease
MAVARLFKGPFTVDDYQRLGQCGILHEDSRVELIDGQVVPMSPIGERHAGRVNYLTETLVRLVGTDGIVTVQNPVTLDRRSQPQPDLAIVRRRPEFFGTATPTPADTLLVIEVADSSVEYDREIKIPLYARTDIPEVWLCDLPGDRVEIYRDPHPGGYAGVRTARRGDTVEALHLPGVTLTVENVLGEPDSRR